MSDKDDPFLKHLEDASLVVSEWPEWKRTTLSASWREPKPKISEDKIMPLTPTKIEWCSHVWNPITGCTPESEGCENCYAKAIHSRFGKTPFSKIMFHRERLDAPLHRKKPAVIFVNSMGDLFHPDVRNDFRREVYWTIQRASWHTFIILTKRPEIMQRWHSMPDAPIMDNLWLGVSAENQQRFDERVPVLLDTPAAHRIVSVEPMLGPVEITETKTCPDCGGDGFMWADGCGPIYVKSYGTPARHKVTCETCGGDFDGPGTGEITTAPDLDWVICGPETGPCARHFDERWAIDLRDQCRDFDIPFFYKANDGNLGGERCREYPKEMMGNEN